MTACGGGGGKVRGGRDKPLSNSLQVIKWVGF